MLFRSAGAYDVGSALLCEVIGDLRLWVSHREENGLLRHGLHHLGSYEVRLGNADEYVRTPERVRETALDVLLVAHLSHLGVRGIVVMIVAVEDTAEVYHNEISNAQLEQELADSDTRRACAVDNYSDEIGRASCRERV